MIHIRIDDNPDNNKRRFACGIGPELPDGDTYFFAGESAAYNKSDCPGCNPGGPRQLGTPLSALSGKADPGNPAWERFKAIATSWGYD